MIVYQPIVNGDQSIGALLKKTTTHRSFQFKGVTKTSPRNRFFFIWNAFKIVGNILNTFHLVYIYFLLFTPEIKMEEYFIIDMINMLSYIKPWTQHPVL